MALAAPLLRPDRPAQGHRPGGGEPAAPAGGGDAARSSATATRRTARSSSGWRASSAWRSGFASSGSPRDRLPATFAEHDALLFPVRWEEPWGLVPLEAMAVGLLVVASGRGGSAEYFEDGENCLLADPDDGPERWPTRSLRLADDERAAPPAARGRAAHRRALPRHRVRDRGGGRGRGDGRRGVSAEVAVAVVSWNTRDVLERCLRSLEPDVRSGLAEVWVVDNGSSDGSPELVRERFGWARARGAGREPRLRAGGQPGGRAHRHALAGRVERGRRARSPARSRACSPPGASRARAPWRRD